VSLTDELASDLAETGFDFGDGGIFGFEVSGGLGSGGKEGSEAGGEVVDELQFGGGVATNVTGTDDDDAEDGFATEDGGDHAGFEAELDERLVEVGDAELGADGEGEDAAVDLDPFEGGWGDGGTLLDESAEVLGENAGEGDDVTFGVTGGDDGHGHGKGMTEAVDAILEGILEMRQAVIVDVGDHAAPLPYPVSRPGDSTPRGVEGQGGRRSS